MLQGLVIRQAFIVLDVLLVLAALATVGGVGVKLVQPPEHAVAALETPVEEGDVASMVQRVAARSEYASIVDGGLFGDAGRFDPAQEQLAPPPPVVEEVAEDVADTELDLTLVGTIALAPKDPFASAMIENPVTREGAKIYVLGQEVVEKVVLEEIYPREVMLLNRRNSPATRERLRMDEEEEDDEKPRTPVVTSRPRSSSTERIALNKREFINDLYANYADLVTKVQPELYRDASGKVVGVTADNISQVPLAKKLGLADGDVLQTVNNEKIDSEQKILEMVQKYQNATAFRVGILRNGKTKVITYNLN